MNEAYKLPKLPIPLTTAIAAARFAGGRETVLDTQTMVRVTPTIQWLRTDQEEMEVTRLTSFSTGHQKQRRIATPHGESGDGNNITDDYAPPWHYDVEKSFSSFICGIND